MKDVYNEDDLHAVDRKRNALDRLIVDLNRMIQIDTGFTKEGKVALRILKRRDKELLHQRRQIVREMTPKFNSAEWD